MEATTILNKSPNMYTMDDFSDITNQNLGDLNNKLFCTFTTLENLDFILSSITDKYNIMYNKIFVLYVKENDEYVCTYNIDQGNISDLPENTILVHRKKETNTLYTVNALNAIIRKVNNGVLDKSYVIEWENYSNSLLLTDGDQAKHIHLDLFKRIDL